MAPTNSTAAQPVAQGERSAFEAALKDAWEGAAPLSPAGQPGSYARGSWQGYQDALATVRANFERHLKLASRSSAQGAAQVPQWLPIETAPKDGSRIILGCAEGAWMAEYRPIAQSGYRFSDPWFSVMLNHQHMGTSPRLQPTHWMPLPAAPHGEQGDAP